VSRRFASINLVKKVPAAKRFWEHPEESPSYLLYFPAGNWLSHHATIFSAANIVRKGILSERVRNRLVTKRTSRGDRAEVDVKLVNSPLDAFEKQAEQLAGHPKIRILVSNSPQIQLAPNEFIKDRNYYTASGSIAPKHFAAVILPFNQMRASELRSEKYGNGPKWLVDLLDAAKETGVPVFTRFGKRVWPPVSRK